MNNKIWHLTFPGDLTWRSSPGNNRGGLDRVEELLTDAALRQGIVDHNYQVAQEHFSLDALKKYLEPLFTS